MADLIAPAGRRAGSATELPVYSVTKHRGFVPSLEYFNKQVFGKDLASYKVVQPGEFAYATIHLDEGSIGIAPVECLISPMYTVFSIDASRAHAPYLMRFLRSPRALAQYSTLGNGTAERRKSITLSALGRLSVPLPPLPEQRRIAAILDQVDELRAKRRRALVRLDALAEAALAQLMATARHSIRISDIALVQTGPFGSLLHQEDYVVGGIPLINPSHIVKGRIQPDPTNAVSRETYLTLKSYALRAGDVVLGRRGEMGRAAVVEAGAMELLCGTGSMIIRPDGSKASGEVLARIIGSRRVRRDLENRALGVTMLNLNQDIVGQTIIGLPSPSAQDDYLRLLARGEAIRSQHSAHLTKLDELFASLQHRAFTGQL